MRSRRVAPAIVAGLGIVLLLAQTASAHVVKDYGPYHLAIGWLHEPAYVGVENAVQVIVTDAGKSVDDVPASDFTVRITAGGQTSAALPLNASFDPDTGLGTPGEYLAPVIPTLAGDYTFHIVATIHGQSVDASFSSSSTTFDAVEEEASAQFPTRLPTIGELATLGSRQEARIAAAAAAAQSATLAASQANDAASRALEAGAVIGAVGVILGLTAIFLGRRRRSEGSGA